MPLCLGLPQAEDIDAAVKKISDEAYQVALGHIRNNREAIDRIVEVLVEKETLSGEEFPGYLVRIHRNPTREPRRPRHASRRRLKWADTVSLPRGGVRT